MKIVLKYMYINFIPVHVHMYYVGVLCNACTASVLLHVIEQTNNLHDHNSTQEVGILES